ncbi:hypothetical protein ACWF95_33980 [Streptomyces vinaceus]
MSRPELPLRPTPHERDGRQDLDVPAELARTARALAASGYSAEAISHALAADEATVHRLAPSSRTVTR